MLLYTASPPPSFVRPYAAFEFENIAKRKSHLRKAFSRPPIDAVVISSPPRSPPQNRVRPFFLSQSLSFFALLLCRLSAMALLANVTAGLGLFPCRGNLAFTHDATRSFCHGTFCRTALFQVALVAQILRPLRLVFTRSPL